MGGERIAQGVPDNKEGAHDGLKGQARGVEGAQHNVTPVALSEEAVLFAKLRNFVAELAKPFVQKESEAEIIALALITKEHVLFHDEPGTAKSALAERAVDLLEAKIFKIQLNQYTDPAELLGAIDAKVYFEQSIYRHNTSGMLPEADILYMDEPFRGNSAIRNMMLSMIQERAIMNGSERTEIPLRTIISAANTIPYDDDDLAFFDRYMLRYSAPPLDKQHWTAQIKASFDIEFNRTAAVSEKALSLEDLDALYMMIKKVDTSKVSDLMTEVFLNLEERHNLHLSPRRRGRALKFVAANALLNGRKTASVEDLMVLKYIVPVDAEEFAVVTTLLEDVISPINHTNRLAEINRNLQLAIEQLVDNPGAVSDIDDALSATKKASRDANRFLKIYLDKTLRKEARAVRKSAKELATILTDLAKARKENAAELSIIVRAEVAD